ncbi:bifunctional 2-polyprenyl-6-hydroxyphenol methylase/3-demethylubiquinol 3-O-methyltransferase UbiG [Yunchengibacter salinarum]|uniref:bifunctional 2-polyprenyl-6-hydroxyphenol methylase/3-demethylubiquinol 3-O-methyltransferase UbiG n=1 Tax=Yunchengibacter salinarum TaxID=3133399 RepID=UPI0035B62E66
MTDPRTSHTDTGGPSAPATTVDESEVAFFADLAATWWDPTGPFKPLHMLNPTRLAYIRRQITDHFHRDDSAAMPLDGLDVLDIGCGGGLVSEPLARLGARVTGVDASKKNVKTAATHAHMNGVEVAYHHTTAEDLSATGVRYDVIINMEVVEHVADVPLYLAHTAAMLKPGGIMLLSTINRTAKAFLLAKVGAEYVMRWLPVGAHDWRKFITPDELAAHAAQAGLVPGRAEGFSFSPLSRQWSVTSDTGVNYALPAIKPAD